MYLLLKTAFALFSGLIMTRLFKKYSFPDVTAFLIAGILVGPYALGRFSVLGFQSAQELAAVDFISNIALGFIAFDIGSEFELAALRKMGKAATFIGILQALITTLLVDIALVPLYFKGFLPLSAALVLGAIASATAPAATLMVVRQFKAKGPVTDLLLPIVALDDAAGLVIFAVSIGIAQALIGGTINIISVIINPLLEIICSLLLGSVMGLLLTALEKLFFSNSNRLALTISFILMTIALASTEIYFADFRLAYSPLLVCMILGTAFCNLCEYSPDIMGRAQRWSVPLYAVFFVLSGASLELSILKDHSIMLIGLVYIIVRCIGKYSGAFIGANLMNCPPAVKKYLGFTLFPQAGVALGMAATAQTLGDNIGSFIRNIILFSVLVYELIGPMLTRSALTFAGEIQQKLPQHLHRARFKH